MISLLISIPAILILIATALLCMARGVKKSIIRFLTVLVALFASIPVATLVAKSLSGVVTDLLNGILASSEMAQQIFAASPTLEIAPAALAGVIASPIIYLVVFILMTLLMLIVHKVLTVVLKAAPDVEGKALSRGIGAAIGVVVALVLVVGIYAPVSGYVGIVDGIAAKAETDAPEYIESVPAAAIDAVDSGAKAIPFKLADALGGKALFRGLTTGKLNGEKFTLEGELGAVADAALAALSFTGADVAEYGDEQIAAIDAIQGAVSDSTILISALPELLSEASGAWLAGEEFVGMAKPSLNDTFDPLLTDILAVFATSDKTNIEADLATLGDLFTVAIEKKVLANVNDSEQLIAIFSDADTVKALTTTLGANPRMKHLVPTVTNIGLRIVYSSLGIPETNEDVNRQFITSLTAAINKHSALELEEMADKLSAEVTAISKEYALDIPTSEIDAIAIGLAYDFSGVAEVTEADVQSFLDVYAEYINADASDVTSVPVSANVVRAIIYTGDEDEVVDGVRIMFANADNLENTATDAYDGVILTADKNSVTVAKGKVTGAMLAAQLAKGVKHDELPDDTLDEKTKEVYRKSEEKHKETRQEPNLYKKDEKKDDGSHKLSTRIPTQEEMIWSGEDIEEETYEKLGEVVAKAAEVVATTDFTNLDLAGIATSIGGILDGIADISEEMKDISDNLVKGALLTVKEQALPDVPSSTIIDIADGLIAMTKTEGQQPAVKPTEPTAPVTTTAAPVTTTAPVLTGKPADPAATTAPAATTTAKPATPAQPSTSYENMFGTAGKVLQYMQVFNGNGEMEDKQAVIGELVGNLDPTFAGILAVVINEELVLAYGLPEDMASGTVSCLSAMFSAFADTGVTDEDRDAVNVLFNLALYTPGSYANAFTIGEERGALGISADYLVTVLEKSPIAANAAINLFGSTGISAKLSMLDKEALGNAARICDYWYLKEFLEGFN